MSHFEKSHFEKPHFEKPHFEKSRRANNNTTILIAPQLLALQHVRHKWTRGAITRKDYVWSSVNALYTQTLPKERSTRRPWLPLKAERTNIASRDLVRTGLSQAAAKHTLDRLVTEFTLPIYYARCEVLNTSITNHSTHLKRRRTACFVVVLRTAVVEQSRCAFALLKMSCSRTPVRTAEPRHRHTQGNLEAMSDIPNQICVWYPEKSPTWEALVTMEESDPTIYCEQQCHEPIHSSGERASVYLIEELLPRPSKPIRDLCSLYLLSNLSTMLFVSVPPTG
ncbi:hypothetical protein AC579_48 [Pseudocercospora musae]|uniref:Uncharacterized protein n=1 Tax=Pseudocercospora musae TaxID=113226 RepID=A0A139IGW6_9PEZI|nr:hypothetical protein AC579_48 [Pseudocercospora musae]